MQIHEVIKEIKRDTGILLSRSRLYHYDRVGLLDGISRLENGYRVFDEINYEKLRFIVILSDVGIGLNEIKEVFEGAVGADSLGKRLHSKLLNIKEALETLS